jgi:hypothetical protein
MKPPFPVAAPVAFGAPLLFIYRDSPVFDGDILNVSGWDLKSKKIHSFFWYQSEG